MPERTLYEIALDISRHQELTEGGDNDAAKVILSSSAHDALIRSYGNELPRSFDDALSYLKEQLKPCEDVFSDVELRRMIGTEIAWLSHTAQRDHSKSVNLAAEREKFLDEAMFGISPLLDPDSPSRRLAELETYLRSWADFPAFGFGIDDLDDATGGILPGEICLLTGAPGTMKTSLALSAVDNYVSRTDSGLVCYCSVDMAPREITMRLMERDNEVQEAILRSLETQGDPDIPQMRNKVTRKYNGRLAIIGHNPPRRITVGSLLQFCLKRQPQLVVIDYLTCLKDKGQSDLEFVEEAMPDIVAFAHQYETSFLLLSQMSKTSRSEQAAGRMGGHNRGGGIVGELAHTEIELFQQPVENDKPMVIACVTKARRGIAGQYFSLGYDGPIKKFDGTAQKMAKTVQRKTMFSPVNGFYGRPWKEVEGKA